MTSKVETPKRVESTATHGNMFGYRGVEWDAAREKFRARIEPATGKRGRWLGRFDSAEGAALAYDRAAREVYGDHAYLNFPEPGEKKCAPSRLSSEARCPKGHDLLANGYRHPRGTTNCRICNRASAKRAYAKRVASLTKEPDDAKG